MVCASIVSMIQTFQIICNLILLQTFTSDSEASLIMRKIKCEFWKIYQVNLKLKMCHLKYPHKLFVASKITKILLVRNFK